jgi:hypothetical protein
MLIAHGYDFPCKAHGRYKLNIWRVVVRFPIKLERHKIHLLPRDEENGLSEQG